MLTTKLKTWGYLLSPYAARPRYGCARVRYTVMNIIKGLVAAAVRMERLLLPHAGRRFDPEGEAAPWHRGYPCTSRPIADMGIPQRRVHGGVSVDD